MGSLEKTISQILAEALADAHQNYTNKNPLSKKQNERACKYLPGGNTRTVLHTTPFPLTMSSGFGPTLTTLDGDTYLDFLGEYTAGIYGHSHPAIKSAITSALDSGWNYGAHNAFEAEFAQLIVSRFPALDLVRFVNSGTEANMMALATALAYTDKTQILLFTKGYHGSTISGRTPSTKKSINLPHNFLVGTYNDVSGTESLVSSLDNPKASLAAILVEPMLGSGGCYTATPDFLHTLRRLATENNALLIFDEVMTSRLSYHGLGATTGVTPDLMTLGKWVGGGMSFGLFGGKREIMQLYDPRAGKLEHPGTFNNNVFTTRAGIAGCRLLTKDVVDTLNKTGELMTSHVEEVLTRYGITGTIPTQPILDDSLHLASHPDRPPKMFIKGVGSLMAIHFAGPDREVLQGLFFHSMLDRGIYLAQRGFIALNILITQEHVARFVAALTEFVDRWADALRW